MPLEKDLLETAQRLLQPRNRRGRPRQADLRRATSTAYYAVFHALCRLCAVSLIGTRKNTRIAWRQVYRAVEHGCTKKQCAAKLLEDRGFPPPVRDFCAAFVQLQEKRHKADYDPSAKFRVKDVEQDIEMAEEAIEAISNQNLSLEHRRAFAVWILLRTR